MALLGVYNVTSQVVNEISQQVAQGSEFRVNVDITRLNAGFVDVLVRIIVNGKTIEFQREVALAGQTIGAEFFEEIFGSMGAEVTGDYTLKFTLTSETYSELVEAGIISEGQTLVLSLDKTKDLSAGEGLDDATTGGDSSEDNPDNPENPAEVPVESVTISGQPESVVHGGTSFSLSAAVLPNNAANKDVKWLSSQPAYISVDENTGFVRILGYTAEPVTITAYSVENNAVKDEWTFNIEKAAVTSISVTPASMELTLRNDSSTVSANITTAIEPAIASEYTDVNYEVTEGQDKISVDENGVVKALAEGSATVTVTAGTFTKTVTVTVNPAPAVEIPVTDISISTETNKVYKKGTNVTINFTLTPTTTTDTIVSYTSSKGTGSIPTSNGTGSFEFLNVQGGETVTLTTVKGQKATYTITAVDGITTVSFVNSQITVDQNQTKSNTLNNADVLQNSSSSITYESLTPELASVDKTTGAVTGLKNGLATIQVTVQPKYESSPLTATFTVDVLGLVDFSSNDSFVASAQGTYKITFFGTNPGKASGFMGGQTEVPVTTDCELYKALFNASKCEGGGFVSNIIVDPSNFVGRATITINNDGSAVIHTKILMTADTMKSNSPNDQYQYSVYRTTSGGDSRNANNTVQGITGRHLTANGTWATSTFDIRQYQQNLSKEIVLYSNLIGKTISVPLLGEKTVNPITYVIMVKESSQPEKMDYSNISVAPFNTITGINPDDLGSDAPTY
ncbi:MAG: Ig-like domain-containing protein [Candidatus Mucispirillum faecigallinarum]|nr:Ig-like domain-containing protein [Candidatus Mucispirillum faecigallinarum]